MTYKPEQQVQQNMSKNLITINASDSLSLAYAKMVRHEIRHLPVLNEENKLVGLLSDRDLQRALKSTVSGTDSFKFESCEFDPTSKVFDYMSSPIQSVEKEMNLKFAAQKLIEDKISALVVTNNGSVVGIITTDDLLRVLADLLSNPKTGFHLSIDQFIANPRIGAIAQAIADIGI